MLQIKKTLRWNKSYTEINAITLYILKNNGHCDAAEISLANINAIETNFLVLKYLSKSDSRTYKKIIIPKP